MARRDAELPQSAESKTQIAVLTERVDNLIDDFEESNKETRAHRDRLTIILDALTEAMRAQTSKIEAITPTVADLAVRVDKLESHADQAKGAVWAFRGIWAVAGGGVLAGVTWLFKRAGIICLIGGLITLAIISVALAQPIGGSGTGRGMGSTHSHPPEDVDMHHKFYSTWRMPNGGLPRDKSCCNEQDCYPTEMKFERGNWYALRREDRRWIVIPPSKIEQNQPDPRESPDQRSHACIAPPWSGEAVFCAVLGSGI